MLVVDPLLRDARGRCPSIDAAEDLAAEVARVDHRADVGDREEVEHAVDAGLDVDFDFGKPRDVRLRRAVARVVVLRHAHQPLAGERRRRGLRVAR